MQRGGEVGVVVEDEEGGEGGVHPAEVGVLCGDVDLAGEEVRCRYEAGA